MQVPPVSAQQTYSIKYGTGDVRVTKLSDAMSFGGIAIPQQAFGAASSLSPDFDTLSCDGLVVCFLGLPAFFTTSQNYCHLRDHSAKIKQVSIIAPIAKAFASVS